jgi:hypothetical protein
MVADEVVEEGKKAEGATSSLPPLGPSLRTGATM